MCTPPHPPPGQTRREPRQPRPHKWGRAPSPPPRLRALPDRPGGKALWGVCEPPAGGGGVLYGDPAAPLRREQAPLFGALVCDFVYISIKSFSLISQSETTTAYSSISKTILSYSSCVMNPVSTLYFIFSRFSSRILYVCPSGISD